MSALVKTNNCFGAISPDLLAPQLPPIEYEKEHTNYVLVPETQKVGDDPENLVLIYKPVKKETYNIDEYINSFADEVGIQNILRKLALTGDRSLLNQTGREPLCPDGGLEPVQDYSNVPSNKTAAFNAVVEGVNAFDNLPDDLKGKMSMTQFVELFGQEQFNDYIKGLMAQMEPVKDDGGNK